MKTTRNTKYTRQNRTHANRLVRVYWSFKRVFAHLSRRRQIFLLIWIGGSALVLIALATTIYFAASLGSKERIMNRNNTGVTLLDRNGKPFYEFYNAHSDTYVTLDHIAPIAQQALISSEDKDFYKHGGFSAKGLLGAVYENIRPGGLNNGGSTITQQLVKNALLSQNRSVLRKYQEIILSEEIERRYSKNEILEMYLNSVYFGEGAFGIEDAAKTYFGVSAKDLSLEQASLLIGLIPAPSAYSPISGDATLAKKRQVYVLGRMLQDGKITPIQQTNAEAAPLNYAPAAAQARLTAPHFALLVKDQLDKKYGEEKIARSGYKVKTTLNLDIQGRAETAVSKQIGKLQASKASNGSAVAIDPHTGELLALVGSTDWYNQTFGKVDMATATRQPGSSFKPIYYAAAIEQNEISAATILHDKPTDFGGGYAPKDFDLRYRGDVTTRRALSNSLNIPAVEVMQKIGVGSAISTAKRLGLTTFTDAPEHYDLSLALGSGQARLTEMTDAYATFANGGQYNEMQTILSITNKDNKEIYKEKSTPHSAVSAQTAFIMSSILSDNVARAEEFGSSLTLSGGRIAAVKTGTTEDYRDAWTIGYTPSLAVGVWIGNNDNSAMNSVAGSLGAAPIWRDIMNQSLAGAPVEKFSQPTGLTTQTICRADGAIAEQPGSNTMTEYFRSGTLPTTKCNQKTIEPAQPVDTPTKPTNDNSSSNTDTTNPNSTTSGGTGTDGTNSTGNGTGTGTGNGTGTGTGNGTTPPIIPVPTH
ncbi:MAG TPA: transglycosylase domain-containing protein [Candidatus Saccharimonadales bacterium]|nr:transglycosylase domain-containing protein [Candidatus Saccharimonadales bacterium]